MALLLHSCNDFLDREPIDFGNENSYFQNAEELKYFVNDLYSMLPKNNDIWGGLYTEDIVSDTQCSSSPQNLFYKGDKKTVQVGQSGWNFSKIRSLNFFINKVNSKIEDGEFSARSEMYPYLLMYFPMTRRCCHQQAFAPHAMRWHDSSSENLIRQPHSYRRRHRR